MAAYRIIYGALLAAAVIFSQVYSGHLSSVLLITMLLLPCISLLMAVVCRAAFKLRCDDKQELLCKGDELYMNITAVNRFIFPCSAALIDVSLPGKPEGKKANIVFSLSPFQKRTLNLTVPNEFRGEYEFSLNRVFFYDILKLFKLSKKLKLRKMILVMPRLFEVRGGKSDFSVNDDDTRFTAVNAASGERSFVRKYADGDDVRRIHWKLSSKQEDYMVWQATKGQASDIAVVCDMTDAGAAASDAVLEAALAICLFNLKSGRSSVICCYDPDLQGTHYIPITNIEALREAQLLTARLNAYAGEPDFVSQIKSVLVDKERTDAAVLITHSTDAALARLAEELSADTSVSLLQIGESTGVPINLKRIKYAEIDPRNIGEDISKALHRIYRI